MLKPKITYHRVKSDDELKAILNLQEENLPEKLSISEQEKEGYVTIHHTFDSLKRMNTACSHIIAKDKNVVVGYALCMPKNFKSEIPILIPMFNEIDAVTPKNVKYMVMGQVCVSKHYRKQGVFRGLYHYMSEVLRLDFDAIITEVDSKNTRSSNAHQAVGFKIIKTYNAHNRLWEVISLKIKRFKK